MSTATIEQKASQVPVTIGAAHHAASVQARDERARLTRAVVFGAAMMAGLTSLALYPMVVSKDWTALIAMAPLGVAAGFLFGGLLGTNLFLDSDDHTS